MWSKKNDVFRCVITEKPTYSQEIPSKKMMTGSWNMQLWRSWPLLCSMRKSAAFQTYIYRLINQLIAMEAMAHL